MSLEFELGKIFDKTQYISAIVAVLAAEGKLSGHQFYELRNIIIMLAKEHEQELKSAGFTIDEIRNIINGKNDCCHSCHRTITRKFMLEQVILLKGEDFAQCYNAFADDGVGLAEEAFYLATTLNNAIEKMQLLLDEHSHLGDKDFGLKVAKLPFASVLFAARKNNISIKTAWLQLQFGTAKKILFNQMRENTKQYEVECDEFFADFAEK